MLAAALLVLLSLPALAHGAGVTLAGGQLTLDDDATSETVTVTRTSTGASLTLAAGTFTTEPAGCTRSNGNRTIECPATRLVANLGGGDDTLRGFLGADDVNGGAGTDTMDVSGAGAGMDVFLNDFDDDGDVGQGANVHSDVENVIGSAHFDRLTGSAGPNDLRGGDGPDGIVGGGGPDTLHGEGGDDEINAEDGEADTVDCGAGNDEALIDGIDTVVGCERTANPEPGDSDGDGVPNGTDKCPNEPGYDGQGCPVGGGQGGGGDDCDEAKEALAKAKGKLKRAKAKLKDAKGDAAKERAKRKVAKAKKKVGAAKDLVAAEC